MVTDLIGENWKKVQTLNILVFSGFRKYLVYAITVIQKVES